MILDTSQLGRTMHSEEFRVNTVRLAQFAAATNDSNPRHVTGEIAPPIFANVPPMQVTIQTLHSITTAFAFHGEHDFHFHRPIRPDMRLLSSATLHGVQPTPAGAAVIIRTATQTDRHELVNEQYFTALVSGGQASAAGAAAPDHRIPDDVTAGAPVAEASYPMDADQTRRYADAARDYSAYTMNLAAAQALGLEGVLVHGMLTMAFAGRAVIDKLCQADPARLLRLACRFSRPVYLVPGQAITTSLWSLGKRHGREIYGYESRNSAGETVMRHGLAEVAA